MRHKHINQHTFWKIGLVLALALVPLLLLDTASAANTPNAVPAIVEYDNELIPQRTTGNVGASPRAVQSPAELMPGDILTVADEHRGGIAGTTFPGDTCTQNPNAIVATFDITLNIGIQDVNLGYVASHDQRGDIILILESPEGTTVNVLDDYYNIESTGWDLIFDDEATGPADDGDPDNYNSPYYERYGQPTYPLSAFDGENGYGEWTLRMCDWDGSSSAEGTYYRSKLFINGIYLAPEMDVYGESPTYADVLIVDGDTTPSPADGTDFGYTRVGLPVIRHYFTISNTGTQDLWITNYLDISGSPHFVIDPPSSGTIPPHMANGFSILFSPTVAGLITHTIRLENTDPNENPYTFLISGTAVIDPEASKTASSTQIDVGELVTYTLTVTGTMPARTITLTDEIPYGFGFVAVDGGATYNAGEHNITWSGFLDVDAVNIITLTLQGNTAGTYTNTATINDEFPYSDMSVQSAPVRVGYPHIAVPGTTNGDTTPSEAENTDFGQVWAAGQSVMHRFTISNTGVVDLHLTGTPTVALTSATHFSVTWQPLSDDLPVPPGESANFEITFAPTTMGYFTDTVIIENDDPNDNPYTFDIGGKWVARVAATAGTGGSVTPDEWYVDPGETASFTVTAETGYTADSTVGGTCPAGSWNGAVYTTGAVAGSCTVDFTFTIMSYTVTPSAGTGGSVSPSTPQSVTHGSAISFTVTADTGYSPISTVGGTCPAGSWTGDLYATGAIAANCTADFSFIPIPTIASPVSGTLTSNTTPVISGTTESNVAVVNITLSPSGDAVCTATVQPDNTWSCTPTSSLAEGDYTFVATSADGAGNVSAPSNLVLITVDLTPPATIPVITAPISGTWHNTFTPIVTGTLTVSGTDAVEVIVTADPSFTTCTATVQLDNTWSCTSPALYEGRNTWTAVARDAAGNESATSDPVVVWIDTVLPDPPIITRPLSGTTTSQYPVISGTSVDIPGSTVTVYDDEGAIICTGLVEAGGYPYPWTCTATAPIPEGEETFTATLTDLAGNVSGPSDPVAVTIVPNAPPVAEDDVFTIPENTPTQPSSTLAVLANDSDPTGDPITLIQVSDPANGVATINDATLIYTPTLGFIGTDSFTYTLSDGELQSIGLITMTVMPVTDLAVEQFVRATLSGFDITIVARNLGARDVLAPGAVLSDTFAAALGTIAWTCTASGGAVCPTESGSSHLYETLTTFPVNGILTYTVATNNDEINVPSLNTVTLTEPETMFDLIQSNNITSRPTAYRVILPVIYRNSDAP